MCVALWRMGAGRTGEVVGKDPPGLIPRFPVQAIHSLPKFPWLASVTMLVNERDDVAFVA